MDNQASDSLEKIRQQFDSAPYPRMPLDNYPQDILFLYIHNLVTPYYLRNQKVIETEGKVILDAGCGSGYKALGLAVANPGAKIVGIDISEESVKLAKYRLQHHGFEDAEFHVMSIEDLPKLGKEFDYINTDDVLYLLPNIVDGLQAMKSVLKPDGIIRANLHNSIQRVYYYRAQNIFRMMGLMDENPGELEIDLVRETMKTLKEDVSVKRKTWFPENENNEEVFLMNYLFQGDKGYNITETFAALRAAGLEFISMVKPNNWNLLDLFKNQDNLPTFLVEKLSSLSVEEQLHLFELLHPDNRLIDFWCGHSNSANPVVPLDAWTVNDWQEAQVHLHPQLRTPEFKESILAGIAEEKPLEIRQHLPISKESFSFIDKTVAASILPLFERSQPMMSLVEHWKQLKPLDPITLKPIDRIAALEIFKQVIISLERIGYVLLERNPSTV